MPPSLAEGAEAPTATADIRRHVPYGLPRGTSPTNDLVVREIYALSSNDTTKFADWVAYRLDRESVRPGEAKPSRRFRPDPLIRPVETLEPADYKGAHALLGTDRGHLAPLASFRGTAFWQETNYLSNIVPQRSTLNRGPWRRLESLVRRAAGEGRTLHVICGTLYEEPTPALPGADEPHRIPSGFWKVILATGNGKDKGIFRTAAFILPQDTERGVSLMSRSVSIDEVERRSGLDLFWRLPDGEEAPLESAMAPEWLLTPRP